MSRLPVVSSLVLSTTLLLTACNPAQKTGASNEPAAPRGKYTSFVNPFVGTTPLTDPKIVGFVTPSDWRPWSGLTYPGSSVPNAMVQLSPVTAWRSGAGYQYEDSSILAFAHTNKGHWNLCNIPVLPVSGEHKIGDQFRSTFSHTKEAASPGYYQVYLNQYQIDVELTSTLRTGYHHYTFPSTGARSILFDLGTANNGVRKWEISQEGADAVKGVQDMGGEQIYFYATISGGIEKLEKKDGRNGRALLHLPANGSTNVELKIGLSFVSTDNAKENLQTEIGSKSFSQVRAGADSTWEQLLSKIAVTGGTDKQQRMFYSCLYRAFLWPALRSDVNGEFTDAKNQVVKGDFNYYTTPSLWDDYRNKLVLLSIVSPTVTGDCIRSLQDMGEKTGHIPTFFHGDHAASFISGSQARGITGFDVKKTYEMLLKNAYEEGPSRPRLKQFMELGFIPEPDIKNPNVETVAAAGVSKTLEYCYDDYALAQMAKRLDDTTNYKRLMNRSRYYQNVFDPGSRFMRGKLADGSFIKNFNPEYPYYEYMYREANAWQVSFFVPHDMNGLVQLYGGSEHFEAKLDSLFTFPWNPNYIARNVETMIGQYCHGNQPDHEAPFSYYFIGKPEKSQKWLDFIMNERYGMGAQGLDLSGMDDAGEMSSWYVLTALGLYSFTACDPQYLVTVPLFDQVKWTTPEGKVLTIRKSGGSRDLKQILVNGQENPGYFVSHDLFKNGGEIVVETK